MTTVRATSPAASETELEFRATLERLATVTVLGVLLAAIGVYFATPFLAHQWLQLPFMGAFVEPTLVFNGIGPQNGERWALIEAGTNYPDRLIAIDGQRVDSSRSLSRTLAQYQPGDTVTVLYEKASGPSLGPYQIIGQRTETVRLTAFSTASLIDFFVIPYFVGTAFLLVGLWVFYVRRDEASGRAFVLFCASTAITIGTVFDLYTTKVFASFWTAAIPIAGASLFTLGTVFPQEIAYLEKRPSVRWLSFLPALAMAANAELLLNDFQNPRAYAGAWLYGYIYASLGALFFIANGMYRWRRASSPIVREQSRIIVLASTAAFLPAIAWVSTNSLNPELKFRTLYYFTPMVAFPLGIAYAILRYRLLNAEYLLSRSLAYALLGILTTVGYTLLVAGASVLAGATVAADSPVLIALFTLMLVLGLNPLRLWLQNRVATFFFRGPGAYRERRQQFSRALTELVELSPIARRLMAEIDSTIKPAHLHLFLREPGQLEYSAYDPNGRPATDMLFSAEGALARALASQRRLIYLAPDSPLPASLQRDRARIAVLGSMLFVPLSSKNSLTGWLALGSRLSGEPYSRHDLSFLESLADQSALAIERAQVVAALEKRVNELNVFSQISQAINFSISFDDLLELIYAQAGRVLDVSNFTIILHEPRARTLWYAFFVENNERDPSRENKPWPYGRGLTSEVIRTGQPILTDDYLEECARRHVPPLDRPYQAWLGVPLNAGSGTLGAMTMAALEVGRTLSSDQLKFFTAMADQAATAIDKARLYQETDERARQLAALNIVAQKITSTLDLEPLLQTILESAVEILGCEAGSLFLIDEDSGDSVFKAAVGPVADDLIGLRVPAGRGIVGSAAKSGQPVIVNDTASDPRWFQKADQTTGFVSRAVMAAPLLVKEASIGVIEVINKRDGSPFDDDDVALLTAFGGQAAVSIENARLFNSTDQALAARVDELSLMQRIDRELNAGLDVKKVLNIVLERAMSSTGADAGSVGIAAEEGISMMAHRGYEAVIGADLNVPVPRGQGLVSRVIESGQPLLVKDVRSEEGYFEVLPATKSQLTIPIRREEETIGVINLESSNAECFDEEHIIFLTRLADHAAIAVANAKLYSEVNAANVAKSEFVSFVSHELKTPMTSIKGYADWLAAGAVGPVNETQQHFLATIRANVDRMFTLVSDLTDITRIESGRMRLETQAVSFKKVIDDVVGTMQGQYDSKSQTLMLEVEDDLPLVWGDAVRLVQVLTNLMSNAHKYTPQGGSITLRAQRSHNEWDDNGAPEVLHISVQDNGYGIAPEDQKKIFTKFFRAGDKSIREAPGTGLGLNIVKLLVELGGGKAWFESEPGHGSTFHFTVPLADEHKAEGSKQ